MQLPRRRRARGVTLIEILVVLSIVALLSGVVAVVVVHHLEGARITTTREAARAIRGAVTSHRMAHAGDDCPTVEALVAAQEIDSASRTTDAWDRPFSISCEDSGGITVVSSGPDRALGTPDDIRVPAPPPPVASAE